MLLSIYLCCLVNNTLFNKLFSSFEQVACHFRLAWGWMRKEMESGDQTPNYLSSRRKKWHPSWNFSSDGEGENVRFWGKNFIDPTSDS